MAYAVTALPAEILSNFYKAGNKVSDRSRQKGLQYAFEGYIQDIGETQGTTRHPNRGKSIPVTVKKNEPPRPTNRLTISRSNTVHAKLGNFSIHFYNR